MQALPAYADQSMMITRRCIDGRFLMIPDRKTAQLLEYLLVYYAPRYKIELILCVIMSNHFHLFIRDLEGRHSLFLSSVLGAFVKLSNIQTGRSGTMIQPGALDKPIMLDARAEMDALLYAALNPAIDITPNTRHWTGTLFTPEDAGLERAVARPDILKNSSTYPPTVRYRVALPKFQDGERPERVRARFARDRRRMERDQRCKNEGAGKHYVGIKKALSMSRQSLPKNPLSKPSARKPRRLFFASTPDKIVAAVQRLRAFRKRYRECLKALRAGATDILWPAGTNYQHFVNGFPREAYKLRPSPP